MHQKNQAPKSDRSDRNGFQWRKVPTFLGAKSLSAVIFGTLLAACQPTPTALPTTPTPSAAGSPYATGPHDTAQGFRNNYAGAVDKPLPDLLRWRWAAWRDKLPPEPRAQTPAQAPNLAFIHANAAAGPSMQPSVTWIGHATTLVQAGGLNVLTDPIFSERASPVQLVGPQRQQAPGVPLKDLPPIDVVLISHNHFDHLDRQSVFALDWRSRALAAAGKPGPTGATGQTLFLVPLGLKAWFASIGIHHVVELDWWQKHTVRGVDFYFTPVQHWSTRTVTDKNQSLWGGWAVSSPGFRWYFSGDTGYSRDFADTRAFFSKLWQPESERSASNKVFDLALIALGAYEPRWFMGPQHVNPDEAVRIHLDLGARQSIGVHWGTFNLTDEPLDQPPKDLATARKALGLQDGDFSVMKIGQTRQFAAR